MPLTSITFTAGSLDNLAGTAFADFEWVDTGNVPQTDLSLQYSSDNGANWQTLDTERVATPGNTGNGTVNWTFTPLPAGTYDFRVESVGINPGGNPTGDILTVVAEDVPVVCFLPGTRIATPGGEVPVESLAVGDMVLTVDGRAVKVRWVGRQTVSAHFGLPEGRRPVRIAAGALAEAVPARELRVTADHALLLDGVLVNAGALVNGTTIRRLTPAEMGERFTVFHVETAAQEIILAEGAPAETFVDNVSRRRFDNHAEYRALHGADPAPIAERPEPRALSHRQVPPAILARIAARATALQEDCPAAA